MTSNPSTTSKANFARQLPISVVSGAEPIESGIEPDYTFCEPFTLKQGPSTWEFHMTDPSPGAWTADMNCKWNGAITAADLTCTMSQDGYVPRSLVSAVGTTSTIYKQSALATDGFFHAVTVVSGSGAPGASKTASGAAADATRSTGLAPAATLSNGVVAFVGTAVGVLAAALAL